MIITNDILFYRELCCGICGTKGAYELRKGTLICEEHLYKNIKE